jgi:glutaredoxin
MTAAALVACSPPAEDPAAAGAEARPATSSRPETRRRIANAQRPERRRDPGARGQAAEQYKYIDEHGQIRLAARLEDIPERQRSTASSLSSPKARTRSRARPDDTRAVSTADVTIFTTSSCGYCRAAIAHFERLGIDYVNRDVEEDEEARAECLELTGGRRGVPVIVVGDTWIQGWSQPEFDRLLASAR